MKKVNAKKLLTWLPIVTAGIVAVAQAIGEKNESERINLMDSRITKRENGGDDK